MSLSGFPFEVAEGELPEGSVPALFTCGLVASRGRDIDAEIGAPRDTLSRVVVGPLQQACDGVVGALPSASPGEDAAPLLARAHDQ